MILGQPTPGQRLTFTQRPDRAGFYTPGRPVMHFQSHLRPFATMSPIMAAVRSRIPSGSKYMNPGIVTPRGPAQAMEDGSQPQVVAASTPTAPGMNGFGHAAINPYFVMRAGVIPGIRAAGTQMRRGLATAGTLIRRQTPGAYTAANNPAGGHALAPTQADANAAAATAAATSTTPGGTAGWWY